MLWKRPFFFRGHEVYFYELKLLILWDGASIHRGEAVRTFLATDHDQDLWLEPFPP